MKNPHTNHKLQSCIDRCSSPAFNSFKQCLRTYYFKSSFPAKLHLVHLVTHSLWFRLSCLTKAYVLIM